VKKYVQFRGNKVNIYTNYRPASANGPIVELTPQLEQHLLGIPSSAWEYKDGKIVVKKIERLKAAAKPLEKRTIAVILGIVSVGLIGLGYLLT
jgi:hypothetical protein